MGSVRLHYLQYVVELGLQLKVRFGFHDDSFEGLLQHLNPSLSLLTGVCDAHVLSLTAESLLLGFVYLRETHRSRVLTHKHTHKDGASAVISTRHATISSFNY